MNPYKSIGVLRMGPSLVVSVIQLPGRHRNVKISVDVNRNVNFLYIYNFHVLSYILVHCTKRRHTDCTNFCFVYEVNLNLEVVETPSADSAVCNEFVSS